MAERTVMNPFNNLSSMRFSDIHYHLPVDNPDKTTVSDKCFQTRSMGYSQEGWLSLLYPSRIFNGRNRSRIVVFVQQARSTQKQSSHLVVIQHNPEETSS